MTGAHLLVMTRHRTRPAIAGTRRTHMSNHSEPGAQWPQAPILGQCPVCSNPLTVTRLECRTCGTVVEGNFVLGRFARLKGEQLAFLDVFIKNRGIIKDVEAELGISYPTVRARLDDVLRALGYPTSDADGLRPSQAREERRQILEELREKRISADVAAQRLASLADRRS
jgi:hypothetical protein